MKRIVALGVLVTALWLVPEVGTQARGLVQVSCAAASTVPAGNAAALVSAGNNFGFRLFDRAFLASAQPNVFLSPVSAALVLEMIYDGARGKTAQDLAGVLGLGGLSRQVVLNDASALLQALQNADPHVQLAIADSVWAKVHASLKFKRAFLNDARQYFGASVTSLDFSAPSALAQMNGWVRCATHSTITSIINNIPSNLVMLLLNAVYFHGRWTTAFDPARTHSQTFTTSTGDQVTVPMMSLTHVKLPYEAGSNFQAVALPYGSGRFQMVVVLPQNGMSVQLLAPHLSPALWDSWTSRLTPALIDVGIPRFTLNNNWLLNGPLSDLGMSTDFGRKGNFTGICNPCKLSFVRQKTYLKVDEQGTTAAGVTGGGIVATVAPPSFIADRPFLLAIRDVQTRAILFLGAVDNPLG